MILTKYFNRFSYQSAAFVFKVQNTFSGKFCEYNVSTFTQGVQDTELNITLKLYQKVFNVFIYVEVRIPESQDDINYQRLIFRSSLNSIKFLNGARGNSWISLLIEPLRKAADFDVKMPLEKGIYNFIKITIPSNLFPFKAMRAFANFNITANIRGFRTKIWLFQSKVYAKFV